MFLIFSIVEGALLATALGFYSFLMAFNMRFYVKHHKWLIPVGYFSLMIKQKKVLVKNIYIFL
jgi:hypothetical protein